ncbi:hypothetical protein AYK26_00190 [Euryarchaeota archaeon SM23-78]|nr:MAG: hypothetical protein AYK26_00190 [Euryarchaeota archaeon SM23-78]MBW3000503.1 hypothetical protein [Candidatus Woesearchaeota archaeon]
MVLTDDESISAEEKIKQLVEFEEDKRKELDDKKKELEEKRKELEQLEKKGRREIEEARKEIEEKIEELALEEKQRFEELEELRRRREAEAATLEETIEEEERKGRVREVPEQRRGYIEAVEAVMQGAPSFYELTNYNVLSRLETIAREAAERTLTPSERSFIDTIQYHTEKLQRDEFYRNKDASDYMKRELEQIDRINRALREREKKGLGDYHP